MEEKSSFSKEKINSESTSAILWNIPLYTNENRVRELLDSVSTNQIRSLEKGRNGYIVHFKTRLGAEKVLEGLSRVEFRGQRVRGVFLKQRDQDRPRPQYHDDQKFTISTWQGEQHQEDEKKEDNPPQQQDNPRSASTSRGRGWRPWAPPSTNFNPRSNNNYYHGNNNYYNPNGNRWEYRHHRERHSLANLQFHNKNQNFAIGTWQGQQEDHENNGQEQDAKKEDQPHPPQQDNRGGGNSRGGGGRGGRGNYYHGNNYYYQNHGSRHWGNRYRERHSLPNLQLHHNNDNHHTEDGRIRRRNSMFPSSDQQPLRGNQYNYMAKANTTSNTSSALQTTTATGGSQAPIQSNQLYYNNQGQAVTYDHNDPLSMQSSWMLNHNNNNADQGQTDNNTNVFNFDADFINAFHGMSVGGEGHNQYAAFTNIPPVPHHATLQSSPLLGLFGFQHNFLGIEHSNNFSSSYF